jgi:hypothetical protein
MGSSVASTLTSMELGLHLARLRAEETGTIVADQQDNEQHAQCKVSRIAVLSVIKSLAVRNVQEETTAKERAQPIQPHWWWINGPQRCCLHSSNRYEA